MVKVSITLPNAAQITFESEEPEVIHEVVERVLRDLPRELMLFSPPANGSNLPQVPEEKSTGVTSTSATPQPPGAGPPAKPEGEQPARNRSPASGARAPEARPSRPGSDKPAASEQPESPQSARSPEAEGAFIELCRSAKPLRIMRRIVVAAEAARRFFGMESVDGAELAWLFDLAGWRQPPSFAEALRNAARAKFGWLELIPGRAGRYAATDLGRAVTLGE